MDMNVLADLCAPACTVFYEMYLCQGTGRGRLFFNQIQILICIRLLSIIAIACEKPTPIAMQPQYWVLNEFSNSNRKHNEGKKNKREKGKGRKKEELFEPLYVLDE